MSLDIFFSENIRNALLASKEAKDSTMKASGRKAIGIVERAELERLIDHVPISVRLEAVHAEGYDEGYDASLRTTALAFGFSPRAILGRESEPVKQIAAGAGEVAGEQPGQTIRVDENGKRWLFLGQ